MEDAEWEVLDERGTFRWAGPRSCRADAVIPDEENQLKGRASSMQSGLEIVVLRKEELYTTVADATVLYHVYYNTATGGPMSSLQRLMFM